MNFDNFTESDASGSGGGTATFTHTSNNVGVILVAVMLNSVAESVTVVGYNANPLTELYSNKVGGAAYLWVGYLVYPAAGTFNVAVNFTGSVTAFRVGAITFSGVDETDPIGGSASNTATGGGNTSLSATPTVQGNNGIVVDFFAGVGVTTGNAASPQTEKMNNTGSWGGGSQQVGGISYQEHSGTNVTSTWENLSSGGGKLLFAVELLGTGFVPRIDIF